MNIPEHKKVTWVGRQWRRFTKRQEGEYESPLEACLAGLAACCLVVTMLFMFALIGAYLK